MPKHEWRKKISNHLALSEDFSATVVREGFMKSMSNPRRRALPNYIDSFDYCLGIVVISGISFDSVLANDFENNFCVLRCSRIYWFA